MEKKNKYILDDFLYSKDDIKKMMDSNETNVGIEIENAILKSVDLTITGHFGNMISVSFSFNDFPHNFMYDNTKNCGIIYKSLIDIFDLCEENCTNISEILKDVPCRKVRFFDESRNSYITAVGHFMKDKFFIMEDILRIGVC